MAMLDVEDMQSKTLLWDPVEEEGSYFKINKIYHALDVQVQWYS